MNQERSPYSALLDVCKQQQTSKPTPSPKSQALGQNLISQYQYALNRYLFTVNCQFFPPVLQYPFFFFYRNAKGDVYSVYRYQFGNIRGSNKLTPKGFSYFLVNICNLPYIRGDEFDQLFTALKNLISAYPYDRAATILGQIKQHSPQIATAFTLARVFILSKENNLFFRGEFRTLCSVLEIDSIMVNGESAHQIPTNLLKIYFQELIHRFNRDPQKAPQIESYSVPSSKTPESKVENYFVPSPIPSNTLYFQLNDMGFHALQYLADTDRFDLHRCFNSYSLYGLQVKETALPNVYYKPPLSPALKTFFKTLCGNNYSLLEEFAVAITKTMLMDSTRLLVIYTKEHKSDLQSFFSNTLQSSSANLDFKPHRKSNSKFPSLNQIAKLKHLQTLFLSQTKGKSSILVNDVLPSKENLPTLRRMIKGKDIIIRSNFVPSQHYYNRLCVICVTDDRSKADYFRKILKASVIDFSSVESRAEFQSVLSPCDAEWIYKTLIPYGLKIKTLRELRIVDPAPFDYPQVPIPPSESECLSSFLSLCKYEKGAFCEIQKVYDAYCRFLWVSHSGRTSVLTKRKFNTAFKEISASKFVFKRPHRSRKGSSPYCYIGLKLPESFPAPLSAPYTPEDDVLVRYLEHIDQYQLNENHLTQ